jgi:hypothetical protein
MFYLLVVVFLGLFFLSKDAFESFGASGLLALSFTVIGWFIVYRNARRLATRSETKSFIDDLMKLVAELEKVSVDFWLAEDDKRTEHRHYQMLMLARLELLDQKIKVIQERSIVIEELVEHVGFFHDGILLDCESVESMAFDDRIEKANDVLSYGKEIQTSLYKKFAKKYPPVL